MSGEEALQKYQFHGSLGSGTFSQVYLATNKRSLIKVAIKVIPRHFLDDGTDQSVRIRDEIEIHKTMRHPMIAQLYEVIETSENVYLVMEYVNGPTLFDEINDNGPIPEERASHIYAQIVIALNYLHNTLGVIHRDIKPENIMLEDRKNVKIIDFGLSCVSNGKPMMERCGSLSYASPEMIRNEPYNYAHDIWSSGILLYAIIFGNLPFDEEDAQLQMHQILKDDFYITSPVSVDLEELLDGLLTKDARDRFTLEQVMDHPWIKDHITQLKAQLNPVQSILAGVKRQIRSRSLNINTSQPKILTPKFDGITTPYNKNYKPKNLFQYYHA